MRLEILNYFLKIKECGSITQAAEKCYISHQNLSNAIKSLEKELGTALLVRTSQGVSFTPAGLKVCQFAETVVSAKSVLDSELLEFQKGHSEKNNNLNIYSTSRYVTTAFINYLNSIKNTTFFLNNTTAKHIYNNIIFDNYSIGLLTTCYSLSQENIDSILSRGLQFKIISKELMYYCVYKTHPIAQNSIISIDEIKEYPFVSFNYSIFQNIESNVERQYNIDSFDQQKAILKQGKAFGCYTEREYKEHFSNNYILIPMEEPIWMFFIAIYSVDRTDEVDLFLNKLEHYYSSNSQSL